MGPPQVGGGIGPLGLVDSWIGYRVLKLKKNTVYLVDYVITSLIACSSLEDVKSSVGKNVNII